MVGGLRKRKEKKRKFPQSETVSCLRYTGNFNGEAHLKKAIRPSPVFFITDHPDQRVYVFPFQVSILPLCFKLSISAHPNSLVSLCQLPCCSAAVNSFCDKPHICQCRKYRKQKVTVSVPSFDLHGQKSGNFLNSWRTILSCQCMRVVDFNRQHSISQLRNNIDIVCYFHPSDFSNHSVIRDMYHQSPTAIPSLTSSKKGPVLIVIRLGEVGKSGPAIRHNDPFLFSLYYFFF